jgi:hypothetical protein
MLATEEYDGINLDIKSWKFFKYSKNLLVLVGAGTQTAAFYAFR